MIEIAKGRTAVRTVYSFQWFKSTKEFASFINRRVSVAVEHEEGVVRVGSRPTHLHQSLAREVKPNAIGGVGETEAVARNVNEYRREGDAPTAVPGIIGRIVAR